MAMRKTVDARLFNAVKIMLNGGATYEEITDYLDVSSATIGRIRNAADFDEFIKAKKAACYMAKQKYISAKEKKEPEQAPAPAPVQAPAPQPEIVKEVRQSVTVQTTHFTMQKLDKIIELLTGISAKLAFVVDELTGAPVKKEG